MKDFENKVAVVTGAASGIGRAMVREFVRAGMKAVLADIDEQRLQSTTRELKESGADIIGITTDVSKPEQMEQLAQKTVSTYGQVDILCNNAGVAYNVRSSWQTPLEAWEWVIGVNLMGVINGIRNFIPIMQKQDTEAHIVNTASIQGLTVNLLDTSYAVSSHAVVALSESMYHTLKIKKTRIGISVLCSGPVDTDFLNSSKRNLPTSIPSPELEEDEAFILRAYENYLKRSMKPEEVARQVTNAIRDDQFYVITHDFDKNIERRFKDIIERKNPGRVEQIQDLKNIMQDLMKKMV